MTDAVQEKPIETVVQEKIEPPQQEVTASQDILPLSQEATEEKSEDPNWRAFREARKQDRLAKEAAERKAAEKEAEASALKAAMEAAFSRGNAPNTYQEPSYEREETEEQRIDRKVSEALASRDAQYRKEQSERERQQAPQRIAQTYPDFNQVVSQENCDYIDYHFPELSTPFNHMPEGYEKWSAMYNLIKKFVPNATTSNRAGARIDNNMAKPKSMSAPAMTQSQQMPGSHIISDDRKAANWDRMRKIMSGVG